MQRFKRRLSSWGSWKGGIFKSFNKGSPPLPTACAGDAELRVIVWLCMIRSRLPDLKSSLFRSVENRWHWYKIRRPRSPIECVMRIWMEGILHECGAVHESDGQALPILRALIELILEESRGVEDYRVFFPFLETRINAYVVCLMSGVMPTAGVGLDWIF
jgi:hypothetical protein